MPSKFHLYPFKVNEKLQMKKKHPCGGDLWIVQRVGADIGIKCTNCGHFHVMPRSKLEKHLKVVYPPDPEIEAVQDN